MAGSFCERFSNVNETEYSFILAKIELDFINCINDTNVNIYKNYQDLVEKYKWYFSKINVTLILSEALRQDKFWFYARIVLDFYDDETLKRDAPSIILNYIEYKKDNRTLDDLLNVFKQRNLKPEHYYYNLMRIIFTNRAELCYGVHLKEIRQKYASLVNYFYSEKFAKLINKLPIEFKDKLNSIIYRLNNKLENPEPSEVVFYNAKRVLFSEDSSLNNYKGIDNQEAPRSKKIRLEVVSASCLR